jgi:hypothetical protein
VSQLLMRFHGDIRRHAGGRERVDEDHGHRGPLSQEEEGQQRQQCGAGRRQGVSTH